MPDQVMITTRTADLAADVYRPQGTEPVPALVAASPYQKDLAHLPVHGVFPFREGGPIDFYVSHGYAYVWIDVPGSGRSGGTWDPVSRAEGEALRDAIEWVAAQEWCTGKVGMIGQSYFCWSQWNAARMAPPSLTTIAAFDGGSDLYRDWLYKGGIPDFGFVSSWTASVMLQHQAMGMPIDGGERHLHLSNVYAHPFDDEWHHDHSPFWGLEDVTIPVLSIGAWPKGSLHMRGNVEGFRRVAGPKRLLMIPARNPGEVQALYATEDFHARELLPWYEHHLKGVENGVMDGDPVRLTVNRSGAQRTAAAWPPPEAAPAVFHFDPAHSGAVASLNDGSLSEGGPASGAASTNFSYPDPQWAIGTTATGPHGPDHTARILTFTSPAMDRVREFTGDGLIDLYVSTDQDDLDVVARLVVVGEDGGAGEIVSRGWLRASRRTEDPALTTEMRPFHRHNRADEVVPGTVYRLRVTLVPMAFLVRPGERIRLEMSCADSPVIEGRMFQWYGLKVGTDTYHHDTEYPSRLVLPEITSPAAA